MEHDTVSLATHVYDGWYCLKQSFQIFVIDAYMTSVI